MKASGAAGPMEAARVPGNAKMLPPIVRIDDGCCKRPEADGANQNRVARARDGPGVSHLRFRRETQDTFTGYAGEYLHAGRG